MSLTISENGGSSFEILAEGSYTATCYMVADIGLQRNEKYNNSSRKVIIGWELADEFIEIDGKQQPRIFSARYTASLSTKAILRRDLAAWRGRDFTEAELAEFNLRNIVGQPCLIQIIHKEGSNGNTYANLASIMKLPKGMAKPTATLTPVIYDIDENDPGDVDTLLPEWIAKLVKSSESYKERVNSINGAGLTAQNFADLDENDDELPF